MRSFLPPHLLLFTNAVNFHISGNFCNCMQTWTYLCILVVYTPLKQKPKKVGNKLGKFTFFIIIVFHCSLARQCLWSLPGEVLFKSLPQNAKPVHVSPTGPRFCLKGGYITTIPWINYSTDS